jgi:hypothetical protein
MLPEGQPYLGLAQEENNRREPATAMKTMSIFFINFGFWFA